LETPALSAKCVSTPDFVIAFAMEPPRVVYR